MSWIIRDIMGNYQKVTKNENGEKVKEYSNYFEATKFNTLYEARLNACLGDTIIQLKEI